MGCWAKLPSLIAVAGAALVNNMEVDGENNEQVWGADDGLAEWRHQVSQSAGPPELSTSTSEVEEIPNRPGERRPVLHEMRQAIHNPAQDGRSKR